MKNRTSIIYFNKASFTLISVGFRGFESDSRTCLYDVYVRRWLVRGPNFLAFVFTLLIAAIPTQIVAKNRPTSFISTLFPFDWFAQNCSALKITNLWMQSNIICNSYCKRVFTSRCRLWCVNSAPFFFKYFLFTSYTWNFVTSSLVLWIFQRNGLKDDEDLTFSVFVQNVFSHRKAKSKKILLFRFYVFRF